MSIFQNTVSGKSFLWSNDDQSTFEPPLSVQQRAQELSEMSDTQKSRQGSPCREGFRSSLFQYLRSDSVLGSWPPCCKGPSRSSLSVLPAVEAGTPLAPPGPRCPFTEQ